MAEGSQSCRTMPCHCKLLHKFLRFLMPRRGAGRRVSSLVVVSSAEILSMGELVRASARSRTLKCCGTGKPSSFDCDHCVDRCTRKWWNLVLASIIKRIKRWRSGSWKRLRPTPRKQKVENDLLDQMQPKLHAAAATV